METMTKEEVQSMMTMLLDHAKTIREVYKYSGDEKMLPMAFIYGEKITMMMLNWRDNKEKYQMAAAANMEARRTNAKSLSFVTDARWVKSDVFTEYYRLDKPTPANGKTYIAHYHRILAAHGGQVKNLPREVWEEAIVVFTNGPGIPTTIQMAPYKEGPNDTIEWLPRDDHSHDKGTSDMLTDWWS